MEMNDGQAEDQDIGQQIHDTSTHGFLLRQERHYSRQLDFQMLRFLIQWMTFF